MTDCSSDRSGTHSSMINMWERLPAAIKTNPSDVGYFMISLVIHILVLNLFFWVIGYYLLFEICDLFFRFLRVRIWELNFCPKYGIMEY